MASAIDIDETGRNVIMKIKVLKLKKALNYIGGLNASNAGAAGSR